MATQAKINMKIRPHRGLCNASHRTTNPKGLDLAELMSAATRVAHAARDKGFYTVSHEAARCVEILNQIKGMRLTAQVISASNTLPTLQYLTKNGNPKIRSEARSLLGHWRKILCASGGDHEKKVDAKVSCLTRKAYTKRFVTKKPYVVDESSTKKGDPQEFSFSSLNGSGRPCDTQCKKIVDTQNDTSIGKLELLELFEDAKKAAEAVKGGDPNSGVASRCIKTLEQLWKVPRTVTHDVIVHTDIASRLESLTEHSNPDVRWAARSLLDFWRTILYTTGRTKTPNENTGRSSSVDRKADIMRAKLMSVLPTDSL